VATFSDSPNQSNEAGIRSPDTPWIETMRVYAKLYATLTKYAAGSIMHDPLEMEMPEQATLCELYDKLGIPHDEVKTAFVNSAIQGPDYVLCDGDEIGIFPPVGGG
jgi:molybdopterin converting factor small subunit